MSVSAPEMTSNAGIYCLEWPENIRITLDRIDDNRHNTTGELVIKYKAPESTGYEHLHQARLNLTSTSSRSSLAKYLGDRVGEIDWGAVLEQTCVKVLSKHREGEPVTMVGCQPIGERPRYLSYPLLLARQPNMLFGPDSSAKSTMAAMLALETGVNTLWLDYEWDKEEVNRVVALLKGGMGLDPETKIPYRFCAQPLAYDIASIQKMTLEVQAELVIVDSLGAACDGNSNDMDVVLRYFRALRSLRVTTLSLDHVGKENKGPTGSSYKRNSVRNAWESIVGCRDDGCLTIGLHHRKLNSGPLLKPIGFNFTYLPDSIIPQKTDVRSIPEVLAGMALTDQIEAALVRQTMTPTELAEELGKPTSTLSPILSRHKNKFVKLGNGKWAATAKESYDDVNL